MVEEEEVEEEGGGGRVVGGRKLKGLRSALDKWGVGERVERDSCKATI